MELAADETSKVPSRVPSVFHTPLLCCVPLVLA
jgi:hypothetical protein